MPRADGNRHMRWPGLRGPLAASVAGENRSAVHIGPEQYKVRPRVKSANIPHNELQQQKGGPAAKIKMRIDVPGTHFNNPEGTLRGDIIDVDEGNAHRYCAHGNAQFDLKGELGPAYLPDPAALGRAHW